MVAENFYGKWPYLLFWPCSRSASGKITVSGGPNRLNYWVIFILHPQFKQLLGNLQEKKEYCKMKWEALDRPLWRIRLGRGYGPVLRQTTEWMNEYTIQQCGRGQHSRPQFSSVAEGSTVDRRQPVRYTIQQCGRGKDSRPQFSSVAEGSTVDRNSGVWPRAAQ
jgi:hypothetical protein